MNQKQIRAAVEAMLFASGDPIGADKLAQAVQLPQLSVEAALEAAGALRPGGQRPVPAAPEHPLAACHQDRVGRPASAACWTAAAQCPLAPPPWRP